MAVPQSLYPRSRRRRRSIGQESHSEELFRRRGYNMPKHLRKILSKKPLPPLIQVVEETQAINRRTILLSRKRYFPTFTQMGEDTGKRRLASAVLSAIREFYKDNERRTTNNEPTN
jgi:hypothetical protein